MGRTPDFEARAADMRSRLDELQRERALQFRILIGAVVLGFVIVIAAVVWAAG